MGKGLKIILRFMRLVVVCYGLQDQADWIYIVYN